MPIGSHFRGFGMGKRGRMCRKERSTLLQLKHAKLRMKMLNRGNEKFNEELAEKDVEKEKEGVEPSGGRVVERMEGDDHVRVFVPPDKTIPLIEINPFITCQICCGYLINAVTIVECLHTFCRSCLVRHFYTNLKCPACDILVHPTDPLANVKYDQLKQEIVSKLLPDLQKDEDERERNFYISKGLPIPQKQDLSKLNDNLDEKKRIAAKPKHRLVSLVLEFEGYEPGADRCKPISKRFIRVTSNATVLNIQHFVRKKLNLSENSVVKVSCDMYELGEELSLEYIRQQIFDDEECIMPLQYRVEKYVAPTKSVPPDVEESKPILPDQEETRTQN